MIQAALGLGGAITGEHGVGSLKRPWLVRELGEGQLHLQRGIKAAFDPLGTQRRGQAHHPEAGPPRHAVPQRRAAL